MDNSSLNLLEKMADDQKQKLYKLGRRIVPNLTPEDMLQPNDFVELETNPEFRYEEGVTAGLLSAYMALRLEQNGGFNG